MHKFNEHHSEFKGFSEFYARTIAPFLAENESARQKAVRQAKLVGGLLAVVALILSYYIYSRTGKIQSAVLTIFGSAVFGSILITGILNKIKSKTKTFLMGNVTGFIGLDYSEKAEKPSYFATLLDNKLLPRPDREKFEDQIWGQMHGANFTAVEAKLERKSDDDYVTIFSGQIMEIDLRKKFLGRTVVLRDRGLFNMRKKKGMERVGLADPAFEKIFEAYSTDQVEARYLLTPAVIQKIVDLEHSVDGSQIRFAFIDSKLYIVVATEDMFEAGSMFQSLETPERTQKILDEIGIIYDLIDGVLAPLEKRERRRDS